MEFTTSIIELSLFLKGGFIMHKRGWAEIFVTMCWYQTNTDFLTKKSPKIGDL